MKRAERVQLGRPREMSQETVEQIEALSVRAQRGRDRTEAERGWCPDSSRRTLAFPRSEARSGMGSFVRYDRDSEKSRASFTNGQHACFQGRLSPDCARREVQEREQRRNALLAMRRCRVRER